MSLNWRDVNWEDKNALIAPHFRVHEALWLPSWRIYHIASDEEKAEIVKIASAMELLRELFEAPINIHCWIRPLSVNAPNTDYHEKNYNRAIGSHSKKSAHIFGRAVDFHITGRQGPEECAKARELILPHLEEWNVRMEEINGGWIHIDNYPVRNNRFFKP